MSNKTFISILTIGLATVGLLFGSYFFLRVQSPESQISNTTQSFAKLESTPSQKLDKDIDLDSVELKIESKPNSVVEEGREEALQYRQEVIKIQQQGKDYNPREVVRTSQNQKLYGVLPVNASQNEEYFLEFNYNSIGDVDYENANFYVEIMAPSVTVIPGSIKNKLNDEDFIAVDNKVYNLQENKITYPINQERNQNGKLSVGDQGVLSFNIKIDREAVEKIGASQARVISYVKEGDNKPNYHNVYFLDIKN